MELLVVFLQSRGLLPMFLQRHILFGPCVFFYLLDLMVVLQANNFLGSNHTGVSPCMIFFSFF